MKKKSFLMGYVQIVIWFMAWALFAFESATGLSVFRDAICTYYNMDAAPILTAIAVAGWIGCVLFLIIPIFIKKYGAKNILVISAVISGIVLAITPMFDNVYLTGALIGADTVLCTFYCTSTTMVLVSKWFPRKKAVVMGVITSGGLFTSLVLIPVFSKVMAVRDVKVAMLVMGGVIVAYGIISAIFLRETPQEWGLTPDNLPVQETSHAIQDPESAGSMSYAQILRTKELWLCSVGWGLELLATLGFVAVAVTSMIMQGLPQADAVSAMTVVGIVQFVSSIVSGMIDQKIGPVKTSYIVLALQLIGLGIAAFYNGTSGVIIMMGSWLVMGLFGASNNLFSSQMLSLYTARHYNIAYNIFCGLTSVIKMFGTMIAAWSIAHTGSYKMAFIIFMVSLVAGCVCIHLAGDKPIKEAREEN